jgi:predicted anti-sigma-YlaC factor YlaD
MTDHVSAWLGAYHDGELTGRRLQKVEAHLVECAPCRAELESLRALSAMLGESSAPEGLLPPEQFVAQVGLRLPRRRQRPFGQRVALVAWRLVPFALLGAWLFLQTVFAVAWIVQLVPGLDLGQGTGFLPLSVADVRRLAMANLIVPMALALLYWSWLASWWVSRREHSNGS